jgi:hypothetical protein
MGVQGVCEFNDKLYVACSNTNMIQVFNSSPPFSRLKDIEVRGLNDPCDIVACSDTSQLYVADYVTTVRHLASEFIVLQTSRQVHFNSVSATESVDKVSSSVNNTSDGDALFIYGDDGVLLKHIELPDYMVQLTPWRQHTILT